MREGALIGPIIVAIGLVVAAISFAVVGSVLEIADGSTVLRLERTEAELSRLRADQRDLRVDLDQAQSEIIRLTEDMAFRAIRGAEQTDVAVTSPEITGQDEFEDHPETVALTENMLLAKQRFNTGIIQPRNRVMLEILGHPRDSYSTNCQPVTNTRLKSLLETRQVGPIRVTMLRPALESLERIVAKLSESDPDIHEELGTAGALCARLIRGSRSSVSNHSWGTAIDIKLEGKLDGFGDGGTQFGLLIIAELFNDEGWYWGATFNREDSMHFEVGEEMLRKWLAEGKL